ncbi:MAG: hypothetical protein HY079_03325 [Elusimicrobia bacterium]|nr:hypothetical protein [Elusimicrobiota bacterium]
MIATLLLAAELAAAAPAPAAPHRNHLAASFAFDPGAPLEDRVAPIPAWLLDAWREADGHPGYADYSPTKSERAVLKAALDGLPPAMRAVLRERQMALYFIENLQGNGITDWALDASSRTFVYTILNPSAFKKTASEVLTERERAEYGKPRADADYPGRDKLTAYGFGGPKLEAADAPRLCAGLKGSPFVSLYGSRAWAEDAADLFVARHLTRDLGRPYRYSCGGKTFEPMKDARVAARAERILAPLYAPESGVR